MRLLWSCTLLVSVFVALPTEGSGASSTTCPCGWTNKGRIIGGKDTKKNEYPFVAGVITYEKKLLCGGTIITPWHVLTAASCVNNWDDRDLSVAVGTNARKGPFEVIYPVATRLFHKKYLTGDFLYDISVLLTDKEIAFTQNVGPACLPTSRMNLEGQTIRALGWGHTKAGGAPSAPDLLREVDLRVINFEDCYKTWRKYIKDVRDTKPSRELSMCTHDKNKDTCVGDSGAPLVWLDPDTNRYTLAAMASFGGGCGGDKATPHTDVGAYLSWIVEQVSVSKPGTNICHKIRGCVAINSTSIFDKPIINPNYFGEDSDYILMKKIVEQVLDYMQTPTMSKFSPELYLESEPKCRGLKMREELITCLIEQYSHTMFHPVGTARMGHPQDKEAVVSPDLLVYGCHNLRVVDASVMPVVPRGNTNAPTVMIAEKGADIIKATHLRRP